MGATCGTVSVCLTLCCLQELLHLRVFVTQLRWEGARGNIVHPHGSYQVPVVRQRPLGILQQQTAKWHGSLSHMLNSSCRSAWHNAILCVEHRAVDVVVFTMFNIQRITLQG
jgi:hypothetical protein